MNRLIMSETEMIQGLLQQDSKVQIRLYERWRRYLYAVAFNFVKNQMETEDILQESFLKIFKGIGAFTPGNSFKAWMATIVRNTAINHWNQNKKFMSYEDLDGYEQMQKETSGFIEAFVAKDIFDKAMQTLRKSSPNQYMYMRLYFIEEMNHKEISDDIGVPEGTSKSQVSRGCRSIREIIQSFETASHS